MIQLSGTSRYMLNNRVYDFEPGTAGMVERFVPHTPYYTKNDQHLLQLWIRFYGEEISGSLIKVYSEGKYDFIRQEIDFPMGLGNLIHFRWDQLNRQICASEQTVMDFMKMPIEMILDDFFLQENYTLISPGKEKLSDFLKDYIRACYGCNCSITELQKISGYSASHLSHMFQKETNETIRAFINRVRLDYARSALINGCKQKEIADALGFSSPAAFGNWFRKHQTSRYVMPEKKG